MTILCLGSINIDHVYRVPHLPAPGETLAADAYAAYLGGKGANISLAAAMAGGDVAHVGAIGADSAWTKDRLDRAGVDVAHLRIIDAPTGSAVICVDPAGENSIIILAGANRSIPQAIINEALSRRKPGDWLLVQNETNLVAETAKAAKSSGLNVAYAAAPFNATEAAKVLPFTDLLAVNAVEAAQLSDHLGVAAHELPVPAVLVTDGADGADYRADGIQHHEDALRVAPVDTTGAGDTFLGVFLAHLDGGASVPTAMKRATIAAALQVMKPGAADAIPTARDVDLMLERVDP